MSEARDIISEVVSDRQKWSGDSVQNLTTGLFFTAEIEPVSDMELNTELGRDARESVLMHVVDREAAAELNLADEVEMTLLGIVTRFLVVRRSDNPADPQVEFGLMKLTEKDA